MRLHFHDKPASQRKNLLQAAARGKWRQREKEIRQLVAAGQNGVYASAVLAIEQTLLAWPKRKIPARDRSFRQKTRKEDIRTEVHMMVAVYAVRMFPVETAELIELGGDHVLK